MTLQDEPRVGELAYFDSMTGLIPVKITSKQLNQGYRYIQAKVTADRYPYHKGETIGSSALWFVKRSKVRFRKYGTVITP